MLEVLKCRYYLEQICQIWGLTLICFKRDFPLFSISAQSVLNNHRQYNTHVQY